MKIRTRKFWKIVSLVCILFAGLIVLEGCKNKSEPVPPPASAETAKSVSAVVEQTTCPVMGGAIDKNVFVEYKGKKVYFCCPACKGEFEKNPEKYISKLPQFKE
jgi:YHS domain-containing protein